MQIRYYILKVKDVSGEVLKEVTSTYKSVK